jgi:hypothetical protein
MSESKKLTAWNLGLNLPTGKYEPVEFMEFTETGIAGDRYNQAFVHPGIQERNRLAKLGIKVSKAEKIANGRQISAISIKDMSHIALVLGIELAHLNTLQLKANILFGANFEDFTQLPAGAYVRFNSSSSPILEVHYENFPCHIAGGYVADSLQILDEDERKAFIVRFIAAANGKRGLVLKVVHTGMIKSGDEATVYLR